ncbi:MAG TPA: hypothetical protein VNI58_02575 [Mariprofundaceae bacterium]|nr:hypothetical protein [Mariprofundaceae bacterium]
MKILLAAIMLLIFTAPGTSHAGEDAILAANNQISVRYVSTYVDYGETGNGVVGAANTLLDTEKGMVPGFGFDFSLMGNKLIDNGYLDIEFSHVMGHTNYVGALIAGGPYGSIVSTSGAAITDIGARLGKGFRLGDSFMLTPFLEIGHHRWYRGINAGETYQHDYYAGGALAQISVGKAFVLSVNGMIGKTFNSSIYVNAFPFGFSLGLGSSSIWRAGATVDYAVNGDFHINVGVGQTRFKYGTSGLNALGIGEPNSSTKYTTIKTGIGFAF